MFQLITVIFLSLMVSWSESPNNDSHMSSHKLTIYLCCRVDNDLFKILNENDFDCIRFDDAATAITQIPKASSLLILASPPLQRFS